MIYDVENLVHTVYKLPQLKKLSNYKCFDFIIETLHLSNTILAFKNKKLLFYVNHPIQKIELQNNLENLKNILKRCKSCEYISNNFSDFEIQISTK
jgi:hypothetical protein